jgi:hypothetical protein
MRMAAKVAVLVESNQGIHHLQNYIGPEHKQVINYINYQRSN